MDSGAAPYYSLRLAGLMSSTSPPPLGERNRWSRRTTLHIDSHTMGDCEDGIPELSSPLRVDDGEFTPTYDPSPDMPVISELGPVISKIGTFHDRPTYSSYDPPFTHHRYGMSDDETHYEPASTSYGSYVCLVFPHMIWNFMSNQSLILTLHLGALLFLTMQRGFGE